jgi:hypothetical protein
MSLILASLLCCVVFPNEAPDEEYLGRLAYRAQVDRQYSWENYQRDKKNYLELDAVDRKALVYANRIRSQQTQAMYRGTNAMRLQQTAPLPPQPRAYPTYYQPQYYYPQQYKPYYPYQPYSGFNYYFLIH